MSIRLNFPTETDDNQGGVSDGVVFTTVFAGSTYVNTFEMVKEFLKENDFGDLPLPKNFEELKLFRLKCMKNQLKLFDDIGYQHYPIKIIFPEPKKYPRKALMLKIYNENVEDNLLRFFGLLKTKKDFE